MSADATPHTSAGMGTDAGPCEHEKEKSLDGENASETLFEFMEEHCPHLLDFDDPLTPEQFNELKKSYSEEQVNEVLLEMENDIGLNKRRRNCFQTAFSWLKKRFGNPQNVSTRCLDEIAKRYGWDSYRSLQRTAKRFGITFETLRYAVRKRK